MALYDLANPETVLPSQIALDTEVGVGRERPFRPSNPPNPVG
jgi:hypothetical protein